MTRISKTTYNPGMKLSGELYERALKHLSQEIEMLREQRHLGHDIDKLYCQANKALEEFKSTKRLGDAMFCAKLRG